MSAARKLRRRLPTATRKPQLVDRVELEARARALGAHALTISHCKADAPFTFTSYVRGALEFQCGHCRQMLPLRVSVSTETNDEPWTRPLTKRQLDTLQCGHEDCTHEHHDGDPMVLHGRCHTGKPGVATYHDGHVAVACSVCGAFVAAVQVAGPTSP
jgi:hypothetical protein